MVLKAKCAKCHTIVEVSRYGEYKTCKCGAISLDYGDGYYFRMGGNPEDFDKEFDKELGIDRFAPFKDISGGTNTDIYALKPEQKPSIIYDMTTLTSLTWEWFEKKGLNDPVMQLNKVIEEVGEIAHEITRGHRDTPELIDALGDSLVTLIGMCHHLKIHPAKALGIAYDDIKDRKGKVINNSFVKEEK